MSQQFITEMNVIEGELADALASDLGLPQDKVAHILAAYRADLLLMVLAVTSTQAQQYDAEQEKYGATTRDDGRLEITRPTT